MARPTKIGLDYYPMDVGFLRDKKIRLLRSEFGASSVLFVLYVLGKVYEGDGYYLSWDKDELLLAADELRESPNYIGEVLRGCLSRSLFDERVFQVFGVLTSPGIQRRYIRGCEKRENITMIHEYLLLDVNSKADVPISVQTKLIVVPLDSSSAASTVVYSPGNCENSPGNPQSKVKESKVKKSKVKESKVKESKGKESKKENGGMPTAFAQQPPHLKEQEVEAYTAPPVIGLPMNNGIDFPVFDAQCQEWQRLYPAVNVQQQLRAMRGWLCANPRKRKTEKGMQAFINRWLAQEQDKCGAGSEGMQHQRAKRRSWSDLAAKIATEEEQS